MDENEFDNGFCNWMSSAIEYETLKREGKPIQDEVQKRLDKAFEWVHNLSGEEYSRLIH